jgi:hypothetical protein
MLHRGAIQTPHCRARSHGLDVRRLARDPLDLRRIARRHETAESEGVARGTRRANRLAMNIRRSIIVAALATLAGACQRDPNGDIAYSTPDSAPPPAIDDTEPVVESPVDVSHDDDPDDVLAGEGDSP